jgi:two-component system chemotaxis sensor kinase CheA
MDISKYRAMYLNEAAEHLQKMSRLLVALENDPEDQAGVAALFREAHSLKGMAATMGYELSARLAHHLEDRLDLWRAQQGISGDQIDRLLNGVDLLEGLLEDIRNDRPEREVESFINAEAAETLPEIELEEVSAAAESSQTPDETLVLLKLNETLAAVAPRLLVLLKRLGDFGTLLESTPSEEEIFQGAGARQLRVRLKTNLTHAQLRERLQDYSELTAIEFPVEKPVPVSNRNRATAAPTVRVSTDLLDHFINLTGELITNRYSLQAASSSRNWRELDEGLGQLARLVRNLHHQVLQLRMMPLETVTGRLPRTVRDLCRISGKEVQFAVEGAGIELDRAILEELSDPLIHMIRNAIDHGIERRGTVQVKAWRERDQVMIQVADDGRGINPDLIRQQALRRGLLSPGQAQTIRSYDLLQLICQPGFSTLETVSETSGRGVGMDVVKTAVERLGGVLSIESTLGEGSRITMKLPLSVAIIRVLMVESEGLLMALPITRVLQTIEVSLREIQVSGKQLVIAMHGEMLPLLSLRKILQQPKAAPSNPVSLVVTEALGRKVGLVVDRLVGQREVFVQTLPPPFDGLRGCSGGTILGDGRIMFVLDLQSMLEKRRG